MLRTRHAVQRLVGAVAQDLDERKRGSDGLSAQPGDSSGSEKQPLRRDDGSLFNRTQRLPGRFWDNASTWVVPEGFVRKLKKMVDAANCNSSLGLKLLGISSAVHAE